MQTFLPFDISPIMPLGIILFDFLFLILAIPIEACVLKTRLKFDQKSSVFYATSINIFANISGWLIFFFVEPYLSPKYKSELLSYVFFNHFQLSSTYNLILFIAFIIFCVTFLFKTITLKLLLFIWNKSDKEKPAEEAVIPKRRSLRRYNLNTLQGTSIATSVLIANSLSYSAITIILALCLSVTFTN